MNANRLLIAGLSTLLLGGCVTAGFSLAESGVHDVNGLQVTAAAPWNKAGHGATPSSRKDAQTWTRDGLLLNRVIIIPAVNDGESLFISRDKSAALPVFRADMLPNEIEELMESSITKMFGEGAVSVTTSNLRPQKFTQFGGFMFDIEAAVSDSPDYRGSVGAFTHEERLYLVAFLAAQPHYYNAIRAEADALIKSATLSVPTIGRN